MRSGLAAGGEEVEVLGTAAADTDEAADGTSWEWSRTGHEGNHDFLVFDEWNPW